VQSQSCEPKIQQSRHLQQSEREITVDLSLQLNLNVQVELKSQPQLLAAAAVLLLLTTTLATGQASESLSGGVSDLVDRVTGSVLDHFSSSTNGIASRNVLGDIVERATAATLSALLLALAVAAASGLRDIRARI
jgi:hypothetical protein